jgi:hypothetical protein
LRRIGPQTTLNSVHAFYVDKRSLKFICLCEEDAVFLASQHGNQVPRRVRRFGPKLETVLFRGPLDRGPGAQKRSLEMLRTVVDFRGRKDAIPFHIERNDRAHRRDPRNRGIGEAQVARQPKPQSDRVGDIVIVKNVQVPRPQSGLALVEIDMDRIMVQFDHPEHVVRIDVHVVVVNLFGEASRSGRTGVEIKSNESEGALLQVTVGTDELALTKSHVGLVGQRSGNSCVGVGAGPAAADVRQADETVEICDL